MRQKSAQKLSNEVRAKIESVSTRIEINAGFLARISYWVKTSPKNAKNVLRVLHFYMGDDYISEEDEQLFQKGYILMKTDFKIFWGASDDGWLEKLKDANNKNARVAPALIAELEKHKSNGLPLDFLAIRAISIIKGEIK